jgi:hypothetical protein
MRLRLQLFIIWALNVLFWTQEHPKGPKASIKIKAGLQHSWNYNLYSENQSSQRLCLDAHIVKELLKNHTVYTKEYKRSLPGGPVRTHTQITCNCILQGPLAI